jgi:hypothetical protein
MSGVGTFIFGRPRPLHSNRRADQNYTLNCEEPLNRQELQRGFVPTSALSAWRERYKAKDHSGGRIAASTDPEQLCATTIALRRMLSDRRKCALPPTFAVYVPKYQVCSAPSVQGH